MNQLKWDEKERGVWAAQLGSGSYLDLLSQSGVSPRFDKLRKMPESSIPIDLADIAVHETEEKLVLELPLDPDEKLYGLGLNFQQLEIQRTVRHLHVDHYGGKDNGRTHAPVPFYVSSRGYGVFVNLARYVSIYAGGTHRKEKHPPIVDRQSAEWKAVQPGSIVEIVLPKPGCELYIFAGPAMLDAVRRFNLYCGGGCLPARHGFGFWHRVPMTYSAQQAKEEAEQFEERGYPLDVLGLEPGWHTQSYPTSYEWNQERFTDPQGFINEMHEKNVHINLWENCFAAPDSPLGEKVKAVSGSHTGGWGGIVADLTLGEARDIFADHHRRTHVDIGVGGYKFDECDGYDRWLWPDHAQFPSGYSGEQLRQVYGLLYQRMITDMYRRKNLRTYGLVRGSNAGSVSFPFALYSDCYDHREFITALCSSSFCGLLWTPEARSSKTSEEWLRRIQAVCLSPLAMINAWSDGTKPWSYEDVADHVKDAMLLRMRLLPYIYSAFASYQEDGTPPVRAMVLTEGYSAMAPSSQQDIKDQYMLGPSLLVAPVFADENERIVYLPDGKWFDYYSGNYAGTGPSEIYVQASLNRIPLFVRDGGIIPLMPALQHVSVSGEKVDLELRHYGLIEGSFDLYDDDGETLDYEKGEFCWYRFQVSRGSDGSLKGESTSSSSRSYHYARMTWKFMTN